MLKINRKRFSIIIESIVVKAIFSITHMNTPSELSDHYEGKTVPKMGCWVFFNVILITSKQTYLDCYFAFSNNK